MPKRIDPAILKHWLHDGQEIALFDVREAGQFGEGHLFHAVPLPYSQLELQVRRLAPNLGVRVVVYDSGDGIAECASSRLAALGYCNVHLLEGGAPAWDQAGLALFKGVNVPSKTFGELVEQFSHTPHLSTQDLAARQARGEPVVVLDGRPYDEYRKMSIPGAVSCPNGELALRLDGLVPDPATTVVVNCAGRTRSIIGAQTLINLGVPNPVFALENGTQGWFLADLPLEHGQSRRHPLDNQAPPERRRAAEALARRAGVLWVGADQVVHWSAEAGRTLFLCDVRLPEEFAAGSLPGAQSTPGGQLQQATDHYIGVRQARLVLFDDDGIRAPVTASWLRQLGWEAYVLQGGLASGLALPGSPPPPTPALPEIGAVALSRHARDAATRIIDLRASQDFRDGHLPGGTWSIRPLLRRLGLGPRDRVVLMADEPQRAAWAVLDLHEQGVVDIRYLAGGVKAWRDAGLPLAITLDAPADADRIDYLFFTHSRHSGDKEASRQYIEWELGLLGRIDALEREGFDPLLLQPPR